MDYSNHRSKFMLHPCSTPAAAASAGNHITLLGGPKAPPGEPTLNPIAAMDQLIADIEQVQSSVHIAFYIWLNDDTGHRMAHTVAAAARGAMPSDGGRAWFARFSQGAALAHEARPA